MLGEHYALFDGRRGFGAPPLIKVGARQALNTVFATAMDSIHDDDERADFIGAVTATLEQWKEWDEQQRERLPDLMRGVVEFG